MDASLPYLLSSAPVAPSEPPRLRGKVERCEGGKLIGWLLHTARPDATVEFDLLVNGQSTGRHAANLVRGDLERQQIGTGRHGFRVPLPPQLIKPGTNRFALRVLPEGPLIEAAFEIAGMQVAEPRSVPPAAPAPKAAPAKPPAPKPAPKAKPSPAPAQKSPPAAQPLVLNGTTPVPPKGESLIADLAARLGEEGFRRILAERAAQRDWDAVLALTAAPPPGLEADAEIGLARARAQLAQGQAEGAEAVLRPLAAAAPDNHPLLAELATALERQQRFLEAAAILARCRALAPREARYALQAARVTGHAATGGGGAAPERPDLLPEAIALARTAAGLMPRDGRPLRDLARMLHQAGEIAAALEAIDEALRRQPNQAGFALERARILARLDRVEEAAGAAAEAARLDPGNDAAVFLQRVLERWAAARRAGPWRVAVLAGDGSVP